MSRRVAVCRAPAFTLIEMSAVLALMAVLAGTAAVLLAGPRGRAVAADGVDQFTFADNQIRRAAVSMDQPQTLLIDLAAGRVSRESSGASPVTIADLPTGVRIARVLLGTDTLDYGQVRVTISSAGRSPSYAVGLSTPAGPRWMVIAGLTGQPTTVADDAAAREVLEAARASD